MEQQTEQVVAVVLCHCRFLLVWRVRRTFFLFGRCISTLWSFDTRLYENSIKQSVRVCNFSSLQFSNNTVPFGICSSRLFSVVQVWMMLCLKRFSRLQQKLAILVFYLVLQNIEIRWKNRASRFQAFVHMALRAFPFSTLGI